MSFIQRVYHRIVPTKDNPYRNLIIAVNVFNSIQTIGFASSLVYRKEELVCDRILPSFVMGSISPFLLAGYVGTALRETEMLVRGKSIPQRETTKAFREWYFS